MVIGLVDWGRGILPRRASFLTRGRAAGTDGAVASSRASGAADVEPGAAPGPARIVASCDAWITGAVRAGELGRRRASVGSTEASDGRLARVGRIGRRAQDRVGWATRRPCDGPSASDTPRRSDVPSGARSAASLGQVQVPQRRPQRVMGQALAGQPDDRLGRVAPASVGRLVTRRRAAGLHDPRVQVGQRLEEAFPGQALQAVASISLAVMLTPRLSPRFKRPQFRTCADREQPGGPARPIFRVERRREAGRPVRPSRWISSKPSHQRRPKTQTNSWSWEATGARCRGTATARDEVGKPAHIPAFRRFHDLSSSPS
jgi:hypothetical protein